MSKLDLVVPSVWIGGLSLYLLGRAVLAWWTFRTAARTAAHARRLADATSGTSPVASGDRPPPDDGRPAPGSVLPFPAPRPLAPAETKGQAAR